MKEFTYQTEKFADTQILRYKIPGFDELELNDKILIYYLHEAALAGRDIIWDQNYGFNLTIRKTLEEILLHYNGNRTSESYNEFLTYAKRVFVSNGIHHHYSTEKIIPGFSEDYFIELINNSPEGNFPLRGTEEINDFIKFLIPVIFEQDMDKKRVNLSADADMAVESANNFYKNVTQDEVIAFYDSVRKPDNDRPISYGLNSQLEKRNNLIEENVWNTTGMYGSAIQEIVHWLRKALSVADNELQLQIISKLIAYYETGDLKLFDEYNILWVQDTLSKVDFTNGFIEVYGDPFGLKGSYQSMVSIIDYESADRVRKISAKASYFEEKMPFDKAFRKKEVTGISARAIHVAAVAGDNSPTPPLGVNLPNSDWIRKEFGSKSVTITNIAYSYHQANLQSGISEEFACSEEALQWAKKYGFIANNLHTDLHEIIGHGSGQLKPGVDDMSVTLKNYASVIEETRADLIALYFIMDPVLIEMGLIANSDVGKTQYNNYINNGLMLQLQRIEPGKNIEQTHMRNRQLIASKVYEMGKQENVIEKVVVDGKTCFVIHDYKKLQELFGELLKEVQRIKSEGDYEAAKALVEKYAIEVDQQLLAEVHHRYKNLGVPPFSAFINPVYVPVVLNDRIVDVKVEYPEDFLEQMLYYARRYNHLPEIN
jgi:dipeptidyl-peptidase-3